MNKSIGGYFELELRKGEHYHKKSLWQLIGIMSLIGVTE
jgi:hypothetical protein